MFDFIAEAAKLGAFCSRRNLRSGSFNGGPVVRGPPLNVIIPSLSLRPTTSSRPPLFSTLTARARQQGEDSAHRMHLSDSQMAAEGVRGEGTGNAKTVPATVLAESD